MSADTDMHRFMKFVLVTETCWIWTGSARGGYGKFWMNGKDVKAHRFSYEAHYGPIPEGMYGCHHCDVKLCVRPDHIFPGTHTENYLDAASKGMIVRGEKRRDSKLKEADIPLIRAWRAEGKSLPVIGKMFGVSPGTIASIISGRNWSHVPVQREQHARELE